MGRTPVRPLNSSKGTDSENGHRKVKIDAQLVFELPDKTKKRTQTQKYSSGPSPEKKDNSNEQLIEVKEEKDNQEHSQGDTISENSVESQNPRGSDAHLRSTDLHIDQGFSFLRSDCDGKSEADEEAEQSCFWNINMACIIAWKSPINFIYEESSGTTACPTKPQHSYSDLILTSASIQIFRFLPILIVLAEVIILISILDEGCKIGYLISGDGAFQMPTFNWPEKPQSASCDAAALLHDWLQEPGESAGEAPACLLYADHLANRTAVLRWGAPDFLAAYSNASQGVDFGDSLEWVQASRTRLDRRGSLRQPKGRRLCTRESLAA